MPVGSDASWLMNSALFVLGAGGAMEGLSLIDIAENSTVREQQKRGEQVENLFESGEFKAANRISIDVTICSMLRGPDP